MRQMATSDGERLAGRPSGNQLDSPLMRGEVRVTDIALDIQWPSLGVALACASVGQKGPLTIGLPLDNALGPESSPADTDAKATSAREKLDCLHDVWSRN
jgi:hypothetical protein